MAQINPGTLAWIALGGAIGAVSRYLVCEGVQPALHRWTGIGFAWGTLTVNLVGCFLIGLSMHIISRAGNWPHEVRFAIVVGFLGAFTTFSTFALENVNFLRDGSILKTGAYLTASVVLGLLACYGGERLGHLLGR